MKECTKTKFANEEHAKHALRKIAKQNPEGKKPIRAYECGLCGNWHLTSRNDIEVIYTENSELKKQVADLKHQIYLMNYEKTLMSKQERAEIKREALYNELRMQNAAQLKENKRLRTDNRELLQQILKLQNEIDECKKQMQK